MAFFLGAVGGAFIAAALAVGLWIASSDPLPEKTTVPVEREGVPLQRKAVEKKVSSTVTPRDTGQDEAPPPPVVKAKNHHPPRTKYAQGGSDEPKKTVQNPHSGDVASAKAEQEWGWLNINSYPWSYVSVDGRKLSGHTPYRRVRLKSGAHELVFENPELNLRTTKSIEVIAFEEANIGVRLK